MNESTNQSFISFQKTNTDSSKSASKSQSLSELPDADKKSVISDRVCVQQLHCLDSDKKLNSKKVCISLSL